MASKLGSAANPPPYKVPLSERLFGLGKLKPPPTNLAGSEDLPLTLNLGGCTLALDPQRGEWNLAQAAVEMYQSQIALLEAKVEQLEEERMNKSVYELEKRTIELERERIRILDENNQLKFKNKVLMAMCTISEGDYKALCKEAGIEPRSQKRPEPTPLNAANMNMTSTTSAQQSQTQPMLSQQPLQSPTNINAASGSMQQSDQSAPISARSTQSMQPTYSTR